MQFSILTIFALAAVATAAPTEVVEVRTTNTGTGSCSNSQPNEVCCSALLLDCVLSLGNTCGGQAYCCNNDVLNGSGGLINLNLNLLNCVDIL
ncbi:hypothetical protein F4815DRAFT_386144 [Daldinia loculata]|uniref:uncharacterized protein n=1 Tax=Daldinia loculata TaxID=103429 RepID=UPI0020C4BD94|nr:uncharacterized protein F4817DRAFT_345605 [Daldinia loculata]KAI1644923.1 hypothetical protein F4817DRAFT_345605 [Daldinia loculata]KAI2783259.1 hypothetical protein F4815DRAFT_386144 [Daldinia loculata]